MRTMTIPEQIHMTCAVRSWRSCWMWGNGSASSGNTVYHGDNSRMNKAHFHEHKGEAQRTTFICPEERSLLDSRLDSKRRQQSSLKDG